MRALRFLPLILLLAVCSCKKNKVTPVVLVNNSLVYKDHSLLTVLSDETLFRGEKVKILKELKNCYYIFAARGKLKGYIAKKYILNREYTLGKVISEGKLFYADKNILIPTSITPLLNSRVIILNAKDKWYEINYKGSKSFYIEKIHISKDTSQKSIYINTQKAGKVSISAPFMNTELIGFENGYDIKKMLDNDPETYFYSRPLSGNEVITIAFKDKTTFELKMINGYARSLSAYKSKARIYKIRAVTEEGIERDITLSDYILEPQSLGLFDTRTLKLYIKAVYKAGNDTSFAISEIIIRPVGDADYARYQQLLSRRKGITKILSLADKYIRGKHYFKALEKLDKALDEIPESLKASDLGISIRTCVLRIYLEKLKDYAKAVKIAEDLFDISVAEENREVFDLTKTPYNNSLGIDIRGLNTYFIELKYRKKTDYTLFVIRLKSRINYLGALAYFKLQDVSKSLSLLKEIVLKYGGYSYSRGLKNKNYYKKNALDFIYKNIPADVAYSYIKNNMLEEYSALNKKDGDYNYFYYILGKLAEKNADKNYALLMYKKCLEITESFAQTQKPLSFILASKRIREISVN